MAKLGIVIAIVGIWLILSQAENIVTTFFPKNTEVYVGMLLLVIAGIRLGKKGVKREFYKLKGGF